MPTLAQTSAAIASILILCAAVFVGGLSSHIVGHVRATSGSVPDAPGNTPSLQPIAPPIHIGVESTAIAVDSATEKAYVTNYYSNTVSVISTATNVSLSDTLTTEENPLSLLVDEQDSRVFVATVNGSESYENCASQCPTFYNGTIEAYSTTTDSLLGNVRVGAYPSVLTFSPRTDELFVANTQSGNVSIISASQLRVLTSLNLSSIALVDDPLNGMVYSASGGPNGSVSAINTTTNAVAAALKVGPYPDLMLLDPWNGFLYVACSAYGQGAVNVTYVINTTTSQLIAAVPTPGQPRMIALDSLNGDVMVASNRFTNQRQFYDGNLTVISAFTDLSISNVPISAYFYGMVSDNATGALYLLSFENLTVFNATTVSPVYTDQVNASAYLLALDPVRDAVLIVDPSYDIYLPGEVDLYQAPLPVLMASPSAFLGLSSPVIPVIVSSIAVGLIISLALWTRYRRD